MNKNEVTIGIKVIPFQKTAGKVRDLSKCSAWSQAKENNQPFLFVVGFNVKEQPLLGYTPGGVGHTFNTEDFNQYKEVEDEKPIVQMYYAMFELQALTKKDVQIFLTSSGSGYAFHSNENKEYEICKDPINLIFTFQNINEAVSQFKSTIQRIKNPYEYLEELVVISTGDKVNYVFDKDEDNVVVISKDKGLLTIHKNNITKTGTSLNATE